LKEKMEIIFGGVGGQGLLLAATVLASAVIAEGNNAVMTSSYGTESRGTFTKADLIVSEKEIDYPEVLKPDAVIALAQVAYDRYADALHNDALLLFDSDQVSSRPTSAAQRGVPLKTLASESGSAASLNMAALGALLAISGVASLDSVADTIRQHFSGKDALIQQNVSALTKGFHFAKAT